MIERIEFDPGQAYNALEGTIHMNRYRTAKKFCQNKVVLDAACGAGYGSYLLARWGAARVIGVDIAADAVERAKTIFQDDKIEFHCSDVETLAMLDDHSVDMAISLETIEHLANPEAFLREIRRVVKPDGMIIMSCPNDHWYYPGDADGNPYHRRKYTAGQFRTMAEAALGGCTYFFYGAPAYGFIHAPATAPADEQAGQIAMLQYRCLTETLCLPPDRKIGEKNCSYFMAVWGAFDQSVLQDAVIYAHGMDWWERERHTQRLEADKFRIIAETLQAENDILREKVARYKVFRDQAAQLKASVAQYQRLLIEIYDSRGYKLLQSWYRLKSRLTGGGGKRRPDQ